MQNHYNLVYREEEREMIPLCLDQGIGVIPWSPLARGFLAGNRTRDGQRAHATGVDRPVQSTPSTPTPTSMWWTSSHRGRRRRAACRRPRSALAWLLHKPGVTAPIVGATKLSHLDDAVAAVDVTLSEDEIKLLEQPYQPHPILGHD